MADKKICLTVALATFNEAKNLESCLAAIHHLGDEIVVVDGGSSDGTVDIAKRYGARVIGAANPAIFHINKQKALEEACGEWILQLDADEVVTKELATEISTIITASDEEIRQRVLSPAKLRLFVRHQELLEARDGPIGKPNGPIVAFFMPRKNYFLGRAMRYGGMYPDGVIRLVKKGKAHFPAKSVHEQIVIDGAVAWLECDLLHFSNSTIGRYLAGADKYTTLQALELKNMPTLGARGFIDYCLVKPILTFVQLFIRHKGFFDGIYGFLFALFSAWHFPVAYWKYKTRYN